MSAGKLGDPDAGTVGQKKESKAQREGGNLPKVTQPGRGRARVWPRITQQVFRLKAETGTLFCPKGLIAAPRVSPPQSPDRAWGPLGPSDSTSHGWEPGQTSRAVSASLSPIPPPHPRCLFSSNLSAMGRAGVGFRVDLEAKTHNGPVSLWSPARERKEACPVFLPWAGMLIQDGEREGGG